MFVDGTDWSAEQDKEHKKIVPLKLGTFLVKHKEKFGPN